MRSNYIIQFGLFALALGTLACAPAGNGTKTAVRLAGTGAPAGQQAPEGLDNLPPSPSGVVAPGPIATTATAPSDVSPTPASGSTASPAMAPSLAGASTATPAATKSQVAAKGPTTQAGSSAKAPAVSNPALPLPPLETQGIKLGQTMTTTVVPTFNGRGTRPAKSEKSVEVGCFESAQALTTEQEGKDFSLFAGSQIFVHRTALNESAKPLLRVNCMGTATPKARQLPVLSQKIGSYQLKAGQSRNVKVSGNEFTISCEKGPVEAALNAVDGLALLPGSELFTAVDPSGTGKTSADFFNFITCDK